MPLSTTPSRWELPLSPWVHFFFLWSVVLAAWGLSLPERWGATATVLWIVATTLRSPMNGATFLFLAFPFFLGEYGWPYMWLLEVAVAITVVSWGGRLILARRLPPLPHRGLVALLLLAAAASLPVDFATAPHEFWSESASEMLSWWVVGHTAPFTYYLRILYNLTTAWALASLLCEQVDREGVHALTRLLPPVTAMAATVAVAGIVMWALPLRGAEDRWSYLSASLVGEFGGSITAFAYALHFFQQYLILTFPLILAYAYLNRRRPLPLIGATVAAGLLAFCVAQGSLRTSTALMLLIVVVATGAIVARRFGLTRLIGRPSLWGVAVGAFLVGGYLLTFTGAYDRLANDFAGKMGSSLWADLGDYVDDPMYFMNHDISEPRFMLWHTAVKMFASSPLLGVGLGQFSPLFPSFFGVERFSFDLVGYASGASSHSLYFELLANQGGMGLGLFLAVVFLILRDAFMARRRGDETEQVLRFTLAGLLFLWLLMGLTHYIPLCRPVELFFYLTLGSLAALSSKADERLPLRRGVGAPLALLIAVGFALQISTIAARPFDSAFAPGFYHWEKQSDGSYRRWGGMRSVHMVRATGGLVRLSLFCPLPGLDREPQRVHLSADGATKELTLTSADRTEVAIPVDVPDGTLVPVRIETGRSWNPKRDGGGDDDRELGVMVEYDEATSG